jgi:hypothetical protein
METIRFHAVVDQEQVIRPPAGIALPEGAIEVTVRHLEPPTTPEADPLASTRHWLLALAAEAEQAAPDLPSDMAEYHDHYAHGKPLL